MQAKRVNIVSVKMVKESSVTYAGRSIKKPEDAVKLLRDFMGDADRENFVVVCLNTKNEPTAIHTVSIGTLDSCSVHPREVFKAAILANASCIILAHNHPSGDPSPSREDVGITERLKEAGKILGVEVLDHIIITDNKFYSFSEKGIF
ncbi:MAG: JAB domain-containing protein [Firmicutes bacterium]|nr:JAB domain-containing protein [Bacillota bacterium]